MTGDDAYTPESGFPLSEDLTEPDDTYSPESSFPLSDNLGSGVQDKPGSVVETTSTGVRKSTSSAVVKTDP